jgi:hypothetical protein
MVERLFLKAKYFLVYNLGPKGVLHNFSNRLLARISLHQIRSLRFLIYFHVFCVTVYGVLIGDSISLTTYTLTTRDTIH